MKTKKTNNRYETPPKQILKKDSVLGCGPNFFNGLKERRCKEKSSKIDLSNLDDFFKSVKEPKVPSGNLTISREEMANI